MLMLIKLEFLFENIIDMSRFLHVHVTCINLSSYLKHMTQESNADASGISTCTLAPPRRTILHFQHQTHFTEKQPHTRATRIFHHN